MAIRQITIVGTGLIGGSLALALKKRKFAGRIVGCDPEGTLEKARNRGAIGEGGGNAGVPPDDHDRLCAWISHLPQMISTALAAALVEEFGEEAPLLAAGGRALREMTRISASPYSMWRDVAISNTKNIEDALLKLEQRLAHIRENLGTRQLAEELERANRLRERPLRKEGIPNA